MVSRSIHQIVLVNRSPDGFGRRIFFTARPGRSSDEDLMKLVSTRECSPSESIETSDTKPGSPAMEFRQRRNGSDASFKVKLQMIPFEIGLTNSNNCFLLSVVKAVGVQHGIGFNAVCQRQRRYHQIVKCAGSLGPCSTDVLFFLCRRHSADGRHPPAKPT
jgi:hypothetical protein